MKRKTSKTLKTLNALGFKVLVQPKIVNDVLVLGVGETDDPTLLKHLNDLKNRLNRLPKKRHVRKLIDSMKKHGIADGVVVLIYQGVAYIIDGNHRAEAAFELVGFVRFNFAYVDSADEVSEFTIDLNNIVERWNNETYSGNFVARDKYAYSLIEKYDKKPLPKMVIASIVGNLSISGAKKQYKLGTITIDKKDIPRIKKQLSLFTNFMAIYNVYGWGSRVCEGLLLFIKDIGWDEFELMYKDIAKAALTFQGNNLIGVITNTSKFQFEKLFIYIYAELKS